jgi:hypothetical protein
MDSDGLPLPITPSRKKTPDSVNLPAMANVYNNVRERHRAAKQSRPPADAVEGMMAIKHANFRSEWTPAAAQAGHPAATLPVYPLRL